jgi:hypothetical protein
MALDDMSACDIAVILTAEAYGHAVPIGQFPWATAAPLTLFLQRALV